MTTESEELPAGWAHTKLQNIGVWGSGGTPSRKDSASYGGTIPWIKIGDLGDSPVLSTEEFITEHGLQRSSAKLLQAKTLLIAMYGASIGKLGITSVPCTTNQAIASCEPHSGVDLGYLFYWFLSQRKNLIGAGQGGAQPNISQTILKDLVIPIAPSCEQSRVASRIDELFSHIEEGERALERVRKLVERYRQSVLKAAVTGELTREWREQHAGELESGEALLTRILEARREAWEKSELDRMKAKGQRPMSDLWKKKYKEPVWPDTGDLPRLPTGWTWASVDQLCCEFGNGLSRKPAHEPPGLPILRISAVRQLAVDPKDLRYYTTHPGESLEQFYVSKGDLLFTRYNGSRELVAVSGVYEGSENVLHPDKLIRARVVKDTEIIPQYLAIALNGGMSFRILTQAVKTSAGQHGIAGSDIKRAPVPLPPTLEQVHIADLYRLLASRCTEAQSAVDAERLRSSALKQSVLRDAFSGRLVPQDSTDEPASVLLERIATERSATKKQAVSKPLRGKKAKA